MKVGDSIEIYVKQDGLYGVMTSILRGRYTKG